VDGFQRLAPGDKVKSIPLMDETASADASLGR
jgi:membrane fusion protein, multidrug efflux system